MALEIINSESSTNIPVFAARAVATHTLQGDTPLLEPEEELYLAKEIRDQEVLTWELLLSSTAMAGFTISNMGKVLDRVGSDAVVDDCRKLVGRDLSRRQRKLLAKNTAVIVRAADLDRESLDTIITAIQNAINDRHNQWRNVGLNPSAPGFAVHWKAILKCQRAARRLREHFVQANLRLVISMAHRYQRGALSIPDLIQEGTLGLMHAVGRFEPERGLRFSTYACWWIRHAMGRATADKGRSVRIPVHMQEAHFQVRQVRAKLAAELGREPTDEEVSSRAEIPMYKLRNMHLYLMNGETSLDKQVSHNDDRTIGDILAVDQTDESIEDRLTRDDLTDRMAQLMDSLTELECDVLKLRFGLAEDAELTFREIGSRFSLSRERIRQIQNAALAKLKRGLLASSAPREKLRYV